MEKKEATKAGTIWTSPHLRRRASQVSCNRTQEAHKSPMPFRFESYGFSIRKPNGDRYGYSL